MRRMRVLLSFVLCFILMGTTFYNTGAAQGDTTPPALNGIDVTPRTVNGGDVVVIKAKISDDISGVQSVNIKYDSPSKHDTKTEAMTFNSAAGSWEASIKIQSTDESGIWTFSSITASDNAGNKADFSRESIQHRYNVLAWDFTMIGSNSTPDQAQPVLNNVEVNPKIVNFGDSVTLKAKFSGSVNSVTIKYTSLSGKNSKTAAMTYNSTTGSWETSLKMNTGDEGGIWRFSSISVKNQTGSTIDFIRENIQYRYNVASWDFTAINGSNQNPNPNPSPGPSPSPGPAPSPSPSPNPSPNPSPSPGPNTQKDTTPPTIVGANDTTIKVGQAFDPLKGVTSSDNVDGNLTSKIKVSGKVDSSKPGTYVLTYFVQDLAGNKTTVSRKVTVTANKDQVKPVISGAADKKIAINTIFDPKKDVTAKDNVDGNVTNSIKITGTVNTKKIGVYKLTYTVSDKAGNKTTVTRTITVFDNVKPVISGASVKTIKVNAAFNPKTGVTAIDNIDGNLTNSIKITGTVNTKKKGTYTLTYTVSDKAGNKATTTRKITVK